MNMLFKLRNNSSFVIPAKAGIQIDFERFYKMDSHLQGALAYAEANRYAGAQHAVRNPCYTLRGNDGL